MTRPPKQAGQNGDCRTGEATSQGRDVAVQLPCLARRLSLAAWLSALFTVSGRGAFAAPDDAHPPQAVRSIAELKHVDGAANIEPSGIAVAGYFVPGDGGGGQFDWDPSNSQHPDDFLTFAPSTPRYQANPIPPGRWVRRVESANLTFEMAGARGDGETDDWQSCQVAINIASKRFFGATFRLLPGKQYLIDKDTLILWFGVIIQGPGVSLGQTSQYVDSFLRAGGGFWLNPAHSIKMMPATAIRDVWILRKSLREKLLPNAEQLLSEVASWAQEPSIGILGAGDSFEVARCTVVGFNKALLATRCGRFVIQDFHFDCINGVEITVVGDVSRVRGAHGIPYYGYHLGDGGDGSLWYRPGIGYNIHDKADDVVLEDCFALGYQIGFRLSNVWDVCILRPSFDGSTVLAARKRTIGMLFENCVSYCNVEVPSIVACGQALVLNQTDADKATDKPQGKVYGGGFVTVRGGAVGSIAKTQEPTVALGPYSRGVISGVLFNCVGTQSIGVGPDVRGWLIEDIRLWQGAPIEWISIHPSSKSAVKVTGVIDMDKTPPVWLVARS
jgi:hypothetical protein